MKQVILAILVLMFALPAFATPPSQDGSWTATGLKMVKSSAKANSVAALEFKLEGFSNENLCQQAITIASEQITEKHVVFKIYANCVEVKANQTQQN